MMMRMVKADWYFVVPATVVWFSSLLVTAWDFLLLQGAFYHFGVVNALGLVIFLAGVSLRQVGKRTLAESYSYVLKADQKKPLVTRGVYKYVRHPIYLAGILYVMGTPLIFGSIYGLLVTVAFVPCVLYRMQIEERMLVQEFGNQYLEYKKHTKKLLPYIY